jgi:hypothetical protein
MADRYEDHPGNKGIKGARNGLSSYAGDFKDGFSTAMEKGNGFMVLGVLAGLGGTIFGAVGLLMDGSTEIGVDFSADPDTSIFQGLEHQNGYAAVSNNNGQNGYVLVRDGEDYELYSFSRTEEEGAYKLEFEEQNDDAWIVMRGLQHHYNAMIEAAENSKAALPENPYGMFVFDSISKPFENDGAITRLAEGMSELDVVNIADHLSAQREAWERAALDVYQHAQYMALMLAS